MSLDTRVQLSGNATEGGGGGGGGGRADVGEVRVRLATRDDMPQVLHLIHELAQFEGVPDGPRIRLEELVRDGFDSSPAWFFVLVAESVEGSAAEGEGRALLGQALCSRAYSSWTGRAFYLEDLYVRPAARRRRIASRLVHHLCEMGVQEGVTRVDWHVLESNAAALALYARWGARDLRVTEGRAAMRLDGHCIHRLAHTQPTL